MKPERDRIAEIRERIARIIDRDTRTIEKMAAFSSVGEDDLTALIALPDDVYPVKAGGHEFKRKSDVRLALAAYRPRQEIPFALLSAHERVTAFMKYAEPERRAAEVNVQLIAIPQTSESARPAITMRRGPAGELMPIPQEEEKQ